MTESVYKNHKPPRSYLFIYLFPLETLPLHGEGVLEIWVHEVSSAYIWSELGKAEREKFCIFQCPSL